MPQKITFPTFMSFVLANGPARLTQVRQALSMYASQYKLAYWYLDLSTPIAHCFQGEGPPALDRALTRLSDERKRESYEAVVAGLKRWIGKRSITSFKVKPATWASGDLRVSVNPEYGLVINGERHVVKLYLKDDKPTQRRLNPLLYLLQQTHGEHGRAMILDCRRGKSYVLTSSVKDMDKFLASEAHAFVALWESLAAA